ncbi:hypothetical protein CRYUN_Cryun18bG0092400 [Craigia yunnanensis]
MIFVKSGLVLDFLVLHAIKGLRIFVFVFIAVYAETLMPSLGSTVSCAADSASVAMPRKSDSSSTAEECIWCEVGRTLSKYEPLVV